MKSEVSEVEVSELSMVQATREERERKLKKIQEQIHECRQAESRRGSVGRGEYSAVQIMVTMQRQEIATLRHRELLKAEQEAQAELQQARQREEMLQLTADESLERKED